MKGCIISCIGWKVGLENSYCVFSSPRAWSGSTHRNPRAQQTPSSSRTTTISFPPLPPLPPPPLPQSPLTPPLPLSPPRPHSAAATSCLLQRDAAPRHQASPAAAEEEVEEVEVVHVRTHSSRNIGTRWWNLKTSLT